MAISAALLKKLIQIPIFRGLTVPEAAEFFEVALETDVPKGELLFREGDDGDSLYVVLHGEVAVTRKTIELARVADHSVLGEMSLVGGGPRSATATALTAVSLLKLPSKRVKKLLDGNSISALKVVANLAGVLSKRLALINDKFVEARSTKREELADFGKILNRWSF